MERNGTGGAPSAIYTRPCQTRGSFTPAERGGQRVDCTARLVLLSLSISLSFSLRSRRSWFDSTASFPILSLFLYLAGMYSSRLSGVLGPWATRTHPLWSSSHSAPTDPTPTRLAHNNTTSPILSKWLTPVLFVWLTMLVVDSASAHAEPPLPLSPHGLIAGELPRVEWEGVSMATPHNSVLRLFSLSDTFTLLGALFIYMYI